MNSIKEIVDELRKKGELDEGVLKKYESLKREYLIKYLLLSLPFIYLMHLGNWQIEYLIFGMFILISGLYLGFNAIRRLNQMAIIYTLGRRAVAKVTFQNSHYITIWMVRYEFNVGGKKYHQQRHTQLFSTRDAKGTFLNGLPRKGDDIEIIYIEEKPDINCVWLKNMDKKLRIKMEENNG